jgi:hypothetical protein
MSAIGLLRRISAAVAEEADYWGRIGVSALQQLWLLP